MRDVTHPWHEEEESGWSFCSSPARGMCCLLDMIRGLRCD